MSDVIHLPLDSDGDHLVEPPIIDSLARDEGHSEWVISFIPEDTVSPREKERVVVPFNSPDGKRITLRVHRLEALLGHALDRVFHAGDGTFTFHTRSGGIIKLAGPHGQIDLSVRAYVELTDIAMTAQLVFCALADAAK